MTCRHPRRSASKAFLAWLGQGGGEGLALLRERSLERVSAPSRVEVVLLDDAEISRVHEEFFDDPTPTDVITFPYGSDGEILVSVDTAERQAREFGFTVERELALYLVHGLLHLCGYEDRDEAGRCEMADLQERLVEELFGGGKSPLFEGGNP